MHGNEEVSQHSILPRSALPEQQLQWTMSTSRDHRWSRHHDTIQGWELARSEETVRLLHGGDTRLHCSRGVQCWGVWCEVWLVESGNCVVWDVVWIPSLRSWGPHDNLQQHLQPSDTAGVPARDCSFKTSPVNNTKVNHWMIIAIRHWSNLHLIAVSWPRKTREYRSWRSCSNSLGWVTLTGATSETDPRSSLSTSTPLMTLHTLTAFLMCLWNSVSTREINDNIIILYLQEQRQWSPLVYQAPNKAGIS